MKRISIATAFVFVLISTNAQTGSLFLRHDTVMLSASECNWLIPPAPSQTKSVNTIPVTQSNHQNTVSEWFLSSIKEGKLKAVDPLSDKFIPAKQIYAWGMPADTMTVYMNSEKASYKVVVKEIQPEKIDQIRIQQDWWLDASTGKIFSKINWIELMIEVYSSTGMYIGHRPFCRIYY
jgi:hypothetical protein